jgi:hypothetical protein
MYYDSPVTQVVVEVSVPEAGAVDAQITAGAGFFSVAKVEMIEETGGPLLGGERPLLRLGRGATGATGANGGPVGKPQRLAQVSVTAEVPKASAPAPGSFSGTLVLRGAGVNETVDLEGSYLGTLIGNVTVTPDTAAPGEPVLVQVLNAEGKPQTDPSVTINISGVTAASRFYQYPTVGTRTLTVRATHGALDESTDVTVVVAGTPLAIRTSLTHPVVTQCPILQASPVIGRHYTASFSLGTPNILPPSQEAASGDNGKAPVAAQPPATAQGAAQPPAKPAKPAVGAAAAAARAIAVTPAPKEALSIELGKALTPTDPLGAQFAKTLPTLGAAEVLRSVPQTTKTAVASSLASGVVAAVGLQPTPTDTAYEWDFGDGTTLQTNASSVTHDYFPAITGGDLSRSFDVTCRIVHDNVTVKRTLVLTSAYGLCRRTGTIVPPITSASAYATFQHLAFSASLVVHNLESAPITLDKMAFVPISDAAGATPPAPSFTAMTVPVTVGAHSACALGVYIPANELKLSGGTTNGFVVYYSGELQEPGESLPVRFSYAFRIPLNASGLPHASLPSFGRLNLAGALSAAKGLLDGPSGPLAKSGAQSVDPATNTVAIPLAADPHDPATLAQVRTVIQGTLTTAAIEAGVVSLRGTALRPTTLALKAAQVHPAADAAAAPAGAAADEVRAAADIARAPANALLRAPGNTAALGKAAGPTLGAATGVPALRGATGTTVERMLTLDPLAPPPVAPGNECFPDDISDADAAIAAADQLVCQLTNETETVTIPGSFQNAMQGDVILSPAPVGGGDMIAAMFAALSPPQHHGHSGMMTANFFEITHCTAAPERITDNIITDGLGIPTSLQPSTLQFAWPGSITQSIDDATNLRPYIDPDGKTYQMSSFNTDTIGDGFELTPPLVVKPLPEHEVTARPSLRAAADIARSKGAQYDSAGNLTRAGGCYYSFFGYTSPQIAAGFTDPAPASAGWAAGHSPAVCSSFVWLSLKQQGIPLVTTNQFEAESDFTPLAQAAGALAGPATLDGLEFYPAAERVAAAGALRQMVLNQALDKEMGLGTIPGINEAIAGPIADQLLNMFAFGNPNMVGSSAWQSPGDGNAVSPDNIEFWNPPFFGYQEPLQYLPEHTEQYTVSRWKQVITRGSVHGTVRLNGTPVPNAQVWVFQPNGTTFTGPDGSYTLSNVPIGSYDIKAQAVVAENGLSQEFTNGLVGEPITLTASQPNIAKDINLQPPPVTFRRLDIGYSLSCDHGDANPFNTHGVQTTDHFSDSRDVNPGMVTNSFRYTYDYNGGGYFHIDYVFSFALLEDLSVEVTVQGTMYDDGSGSVQDEYSLTPFNIPMGGTWSGWMSMEHDGFSYHNGPAVLTFSITNNQQSG